MHGGVKFYRGSAAAARSYVEADHSRADDYYLAEGTGVAERYVATVPGRGGTRCFRSSGRGTLDGDAYERWVAGYDVADRRGRRVGCATTPARCGSSRSSSTGRSPGRSPRRSTPTSRRRTTRRWIGRLVR